MSTSVLPEVPTALTKAQHRRCVLTFLLMATATMYYWNAVLGVLYSVVIVKLPEHSWLPDTVTAVYSTVACISAFALSYFGALRVPFNIGGALLLAFMSILFPITLSYAAGTTSAVLLVITAAIAGVAEMLVQCSGYAIGVILPRSYGGWISFGYGICGMMTFLLWMLFSQAIFDINEDSDDIAQWSYASPIAFLRRRQLLPAAAPRQLRASLDKRIEGALWCHFGVAALINVVSACTFFFLLKEPYVRQAIADATSGEKIVKRSETQKLMDEERQTSVDGHKEDPEGKGSRHGSDGSIVSIAMAEQQLTGTVSTSQSIIEESTLTLWGVFKRSWALQLSMALLMGVSMMAYPNIGPYGWQRTIKENDILTGIFQTGDFVGRYIPNLVPALFLFPAKVTEGLTLLRLLLLALFIVIKHTPGDNVLQVYGVQCMLMACLALSHGWYASIFMTRIPQALDHPHDKARASSMAVMLLVAAIAIGLWLAKAA